MGSRGLLLYKQKTLEEVTTTQQTSSGMQCQGLTSLAGGLWKQLQKVGWGFLLVCLFVSHVKEVSKNGSLLETCRAEKTNSLFY